MGARENRGETGRIGGEMRRIGSGRSGEQGVGDRENRGEMRRIEGTGGRSGE